jgi:hypothetical protein
LCLAKTYRYWQSGRPCTYRHGRSYRYA